MRKHLFDLSMIQFTEEATLSKMITYGCQLRGNIKKKVYAVVIRKPSKMTINDFFFPFDRKILLKNSIRPFILYTSLFQDKKTHFLLRHSKNALIIVTFFLCLYSKVYKRVWERRIIGIVTRGMTNDVTHQQPSQNKGKPN